MTKRFAIPDDQLRPIAEGHGACFASDRVVVDGQKVGYMYREEPDFDEDSGWRFFSGAESQKYLNNPDNLGIYDVNMIANYDPEIVEHLDAPIGSAFERNPETGEWEELEPEEE